MNKSLDGILRGLVLGAALSAACFGETQVPAPRAQYGEESASGVLDPYLGILEYKARHGLLPDADKCFLRVIARGAGSALTQARLPKVASIGGIFTSWCSAGDLAGLKSDPGVERMEVGGPVMVSQSCAALSRNAAGETGQLPGHDADAAGAGVVIGIVDTGLALGNSDFFDPDAKTLGALCMWDQTDQSQTSPAVFAHSYGSEYGRPELIDAILGNRFITRDPTGHGTAVASLCSGRWGIAPGADIVFVKYSGSVAEALDAVCYIFDKAARLGRPAVVNLSCGTHSGAHDGSSLLEQALAALSGSGRIVVCAAGNAEPGLAFAGRSATGELSMSLEALERPAGTSGSPAAVYATGDFTEAQLRSNDASGVECRIASGRRGVFRFPNGVSAFYDCQPAPLRDGRALLLVEFDYGRAARKAESWTLCCRRDSSADARRDVSVNAWISDGAESLRFAEAGNAAAITVMMPATSPAVIAVGRIDSSDASASLPAPCTVAGVRKPECYAPGQDVLVSVPHAPESPARRYTSRRTGSSFSAPQITGLVAAALQYKATLTKEDVVSLLAGSVPGGDRRAREEGVLVRDPRQLVDNLQFRADRAAPGAAGPAEAKQ